MAISGAAKGLRTRGSFNVDVKFHGNWVKFNTIAGSMDILLVMALREGSRKFAEEYRDKVKKNIETGGKRFGYAQNSPDYLRRKLRSGGSGTTMNWSGTFKNSIEVIENSKGTQFGVGIPKGKKRSNYGSGDSNSLQVHEYANILEHGLPPKMPKRPVFSDTFTKDMNGKKGLQKYIEFSIMKNFGTKGINVTKL